MKYILSIAAVFIFLSACERETQINIPPQPPKLVAESQQSQNSFPIVRVSRTRGVTDPLPIGGQADIYIVRNATVLLYENDILIDTLKYDAGTEKYKAAIAMIGTGKTYKLILSATGFTAAEAISVTPSLVNINNLAFIRNAKNDRDGNPLDEIKINFNDNAVTSDYYLIRIKDANGNYLYCITTNDKDVEKLVYEDPLYPDDCLQSNRLLLEDVNFNGNVKTVTLYASNGQLEPVNTPGGTKRATVELLHINKDYFKFIKSVNSFENASDNPFAEPVNLYSNVKNGYGLFTTYGRVVDSIR